MVHTELESGFNTLSAPRADENLSVHPARRVNILSVDANASAARPVDLAGNLDPRSNEQFPIGFITLNPAEFRTSFGHNVRPVAYPHNMPPPPAFPGRNDRAY